MLPTEDELRRELERERALLMETIKTEQEEIGTRTAGRKKSGGRTMS